MAISSELEGLLSAWLPRQSWFPGLGGFPGEEPDITPMSVARLFEFGPADTEIGTPDAIPGTSLEGPSLTIQGHEAIIEVSTRSAVKRLNVPLSFRTVEDYALRPHLIGVIEDITLGTCWVYDGAADPIFVVTLAQAMATGRRFPGGQVQSDRVGEPGSRFEALTSGQMLVAKAGSVKFGLLENRQNASSVVIADEAEPCVLTIFRVLEPGSAAAVTVPVALTQADSAAVPHVLGWATGRWFDAETLETTSAPIGMLARTEPDAVPAWREAVDTVLEVDSGSIGSYNRRAMSLGGRVGELHLELAGEFGMVRSDGEPTDSWVKKWSDRVDWALSRAPLALGNLQAPLRAHQRALAALENVGALQRIHGELTLNHVVNSAVGGFQVVDFADSPRDDPKPPSLDIVALLRSIDYAAGFARLRRTGALEENAMPSTVGLSGLDQSGLRDVADSPEYLWSSQAQNALLTGYSHAVGASVGLHNPVLRAALVDRLLVEVVTELRNRPTWLIVPLATLSLLLRGKLAHDPSGAPEILGAVVGTEAAGTPAGEAFVPQADALRRAEEFARTEAARTEATPTGAARAGAVPADASPEDPEAVVPTPVPSEEDPAGEADPGGDADPAPEAPATPQNAVEVPENDPDFEELPGASAAPAPRAATDTPSADPDSGDDEDDDEVDDGEIDIYPPMPAKPAAPPKPAAAPEPAAGPKPATAPKAAGPKPAAPKAAGPKPAAPKPATPPAPPKPAAQPQQKPGDRS